jgi:hypothetical protein
VATEKIKQEELEHRYIGEQHKTLMAKCFWNLKVESEFVGQPERHAGHTKHSHDEIVPRSGCKTLFRT